MTYFLKCCGFQELGSVGEDGKAKRGRYLMSSLNENIVKFFPPLSRTIPNDTALIPIVPLYLNKKIYVNYVYHNSKYSSSESKNTRNEYRIYLNSELENHSLYFCAEDIVIMRKSDEPEIIDEGEEQFVYYLDVVKDHSSAQYIKLNRIIEEYPIRGCYGLYDGEIDFFEEKVKQYKALDTNVEIQIDKTVTDRINKIADENQQNIFNTATFRDFVMSGYANACAVSGCKSDGSFENELDVVYIKPKAAGGNCFPSNGIVLAKRFSLAFVKGEFTLSDNFEIMVHPECLTDELKKYDLQPIRIPHNKFFQPGKENLEYHRNNVYGSFKR